MNRKIFVCLYVFYVAAFATSFTDIADKANLPLLSLDLQERKLAKIELPNGLQALIISDPAADQSAACMCVGAGSWSDPKEFAGMAHFCEHMLFMGTEKYPDTNAFFSELSNHDGHANAYTSVDKTVYMFSCQENGFIALLDRFSRFFIDPLFNPSNISRELHAVDQEFALHKENDGRRGLYVLKEIGNPNHPQHLFSTGNAQTLSQIPQSALKKWHQTHYSADRMQLIIYSSLPLDQLKQLASTVFADVPKQVTVPVSFSGEISSEKQKKQIVYIEPVQNRQLLSLSWELPQDLVKDDTKSAELIAYVLGKGSPKSLHEFLKSKSLIDDMQVNINHHRGKDYAFFEVHFALSDLGVQQIQEIITIFFQSIQNVKETGISEDLFHERNTLAKLGYQFQKRTHAFQFVQDLADTLSQESLATYPRQSLLGSKYDPYRIRQVMDYLSFQNCCLTFLIPQEVSKIPYDHKEKWLGVEYTVQPIDPVWKDRFAHVSSNPEIILTETNPFLPKDFSILEDPSLSSQPIALTHPNSGSAYFARFPEFKTPESAIYLRLYSPELKLNARSSVLASLYLDHLTDLLNPLLTAANIAKMDAKFGVEKNFLSLKISGFSEKMPLFLRQIVQKMPQNPPTIEQFQIYFARHKKNYANSLREPPYMQSMSLLSSLLSEGKATNAEKLVALQEITFEDFQNFHSQLFEKTYLQAIFAGNLSIKTAESCWLDIIHSLCRSPYPKEQIQTAKALHLPDDEGPFMITRETRSQGNAAVLLIDEGDFSSSKKASQKVLSSALQEPFFDTLRTKQKTGYIAVSNDTECEKRLYQIFLVQSNTHQPDDLLYRFELFLEEFRQDLTLHISKDRFEMLKSSLIKNLQTRYRNIELKTELMDVLAFDEEGNFSLIDERIAALKALSYEHFMSDAKEILSRSNHKRLAILYNGQIRSPFSYLPVSEEDFAKSVTYAPKNLSQ